MKAEVLKHKDVRGNELLYLKLTHEKTNEEILINIGQKTFDSVKNMGNPDKNLTEKDINKITKIK